MNKNLFPFRVLILAVGLFFSGHSVLAQPGKVYKSLSEVKSPEDVYILKLRWDRLKSIPPEVFSFVNLRELDLSRNSIDTIPPQIAYLQHLEVLNLARNAIHYLPDEIALLPSLRRIDMSRNPLMELPDNMSFMVSLRELVLWSTNLYRLPETFGELDGTLEVLDLRSCQLSISDQETIEALLPSVKKLWDQACNCR